MRRYDAIAIGSGINALVAGALLARKGWTVCVLERNDWLGGADLPVRVVEDGGGRGVRAVGVGERELRG